MKSRFCPSPTGYMHLGNARTALFNALLAHKEQGQFLLRIEDTDQSRSSENFTEVLFADLQWLGLAWHEGPGADEAHGPYWQSQRQAVYDHHYAVLKQADLAYACFCSEEQLALNRKVQRASGQPPRYPGTCRHLNEQEVSAKLAEGLKPTLRFRVPTGEKIEFMDLVRGQQVFFTDDIGDFIIRRADGTASFMFCNAVDDALMGVTHALRGEDHLTNTPRQLMILQALHLPAPTYGHISLILGSDGAPLSKRNGSRSIKELREQGFLPEALVNYLARLGHYYQEERFLSLAELGERFAIEHLGRAPAKFDADQLTRWQKQTIERAAPAVLWQWMAELTQELVPDSLALEFIEVVKANIVFPSDAKKWAQALFAEHLDHSSEAKAIFKEAGVEFFETALAGLPQSNTNFKALADFIKSKLEIKGKQLFLPLRLALTGEAHGPEMVRVLPLMGVEQARQRLEAALYLA